MLNINRYFYKSCIFNILKKNYFNFSPLTERVQDTPDCFEWATEVIIHSPMTDACLFVTRQECQDWLRPAAKKSSGPTAIAFQNIKQRNNVIFFSRKKNFFTSFFSTVFFASSHLTHTHTHSIYMCVWNFYCLYKYIHKTTATQREGTDRKLITFEFAKDHHS